MNREPTVRWNNRGEIPKVAVIAAIGARTWSAISTLGALAWFATLHEISAQYAVATTQDLRPCLTTLTSMRLVIVVPAGRR